MGSGKDTLMVESFQKAAYTMGKENSELLCNASFSMCMDNIQSSGTFRIGTKYSSLFLLVCNYDSYNGSTFVCNATSCRDVTVTIFYCKYKK